MACKMLQALQSIVFTLLACHIAAENPCDVTTTLHDFERRYTSYKVGSGETDVCDKYLKKTGAWYRIPDVQMPASPPKLFRCGTTYPIWFNGTIPKQLHEEQSGNGCVVDSMNGGCTDFYPIRIRNCGSYSAYFLQPTKSCQQAYCFGDGIADVPPNETLHNVVVRPELDSGELRQINIFKCDFGSNLKSPFYQVSWTVNGESFLSRTASKTKLDTLYITQDDLQKFDKTISCIVRAKNNKLGRPGPASKSPDFYVGVKVNSTSLVIKHKEDAVIKFTFTAPIAGIIDPDTGQRRGGTVQVQMYTPNNGYDDKCKAELGAHDVHCRTSFLDTEWNKTHALRVKYQGEGKYNADLNTYIIRLNVAAFGTKWDRYELPSIQVNVEAPNIKWQGKTCKSHNDPHMTTFDGRQYEHQYEGVFILYKHDDINRPMEVQIKLQSCYNDGNVPFCNCGVAVRAGGDVFIVNKCDKQHPQFEFRTCHDKILDVRRQKTDEKQYTIFFPTGTSVDITASMTYFNVDVKASFHDYEKSSGLCGHMSDTCKDDFILRDKTQSKVHGTLLECNEPPRPSYDLRPRDFSDSWRIGKMHTSENLFYLDFDSTSISLWSIQDRCCKCPKDYSDTESGKFECSPLLTVPCTRDKYYDPVGHKTCHARSLRKRRSIEFPHKSYDRHRRKRSVQNPRPVENVTMTQDEAYQYCKGVLGGSGVFKACSEVPNVQGESSIQNCALDIQLSKSLSWTQATMESFKANCFGELLSNTTLEEEPEDGGESIADAVRSILCPGLPECSGKGLCVNGTCECTSDFIASDCSIDKRTPPVMYGVRGDGLCDTSEIECDTAFVLGEDVGNSPNLSCSLKKYHISKTGNKTLVNSWISKAQLETIMEIHCPLNESTSSRTKRDVNEKTQDRFVEAYELSISYDMEHFGDALDLTIYDSKCQIVDTDASPPQYAIKSGTCFIEGNCYSQEEQNAENICLACDPNYPYTWSTPQSVAGCRKIEDTQENNAWIAGPVVGGIVVICMVSMAVVFYQKRSRMKIKDAHAVQ